MMLDPAQRARNSLMTLCYTAARFARQNTARRMPTVALDSPPADNRLFTFTVGLSLFVHVLAIGLVKFSPVDPRTLFNRMPLDIVLVNARSVRAPVKPDVLAQANLDGGGNTDENRRIKTPLPAQQVEDPSPELALAAKRQAENESQQRKLLSDLRDAPRIAATEVRKTQVAAQTGIDVDAMRQQASEIARLEGEIAREVDAYQKRPRTATVGARAKSAVEAQYVDDWRIKIERVGNLNYPTNARGDRLYGKLLVTVEINLDGTLRSVSFNRCTGCSTDTALEQATTRIVRMSSPYARLPAGILDNVGKPADILSITRTWTFSRGDTQIN